MDLEHPLGIICEKCNWEHNLDEESDDINAIGPNGMTLSDYRGKWIRAGKPIGIPSWQWPEEVN
jgi:hypothetical protein